MSNVVETTTAGWRPDPSGRYEWRYWDNGWTNRVANSASPKPATRRPEPPAPRAVPRDTSGTAPPPSVSEMAVLRAVATGRGQRRVVRAALPAPAHPAAPSAPPATYPSPASPATYPSPASPASPPRAPAPAPDRRGIFASLAGWFRTLAAEEESYHSPKAGVALDPHPRGNSILAGGPRNYGQAGLVALAAFGLGVGAYLPWLTGTVGFAAFQRSGLDLGRAWGFTGLAAAIVLAGVLAVRMRPLRFVSMGLAMTTAVLTTRELLEAHELVTSMNRSVGVAAQIGVGLWIMLSAAAGLLVASFRTSPPG